jgi:hypothetical protein
MSPWIPHAVRSVSSGSCQLKSQRPYQYQRDDLFLTEILATQPSNGESRAHWSKVPFKELLRRDGLWFRSLGLLWRNDDAALFTRIMLENEYWERLWIVQELALARPESHINMDTGCFMTATELDALKECLLNTYGHGELSNLQEVEEFRQEISLISSRATWFNETRGLDKLFTLCDISTIQRRLATPGCLGYQG